MGHVPGNMRWIIQGDLPLFLSSSLRRNLSPPHPQSQSREQGERHHSATTDVTCCGSQTCGRRRASLRKQRSTGMQVHVAEDVEGQGRTKNASRAAGPVDQPGYVTEQLSRTYGYGMLVALPTILFVLALALLPYTRWQEDGASSTATSSADAGNTTTQGQVGVAPGVNRDVWTAFQAFVFPTVVAVRTMFATSTEDPRPLPGRERFSWAYAPQ